MMENEPFIYNPKIVVFEFITIARSPHRHNDLVDFILFRIASIFISGNLSPSPYWPGPHLKKRDRPATCDGSWWGSIRDRSVFVI